MDTQTVVSKDYQAPEEVRVRCPKCQQVFFPKLGGGRDPEKVECIHCHRKIRRSELEVLE